MFHLKLTSARRMLRGLRIQGWGVPDNRYLLLTDMAENRISRPPRGRSGSHLPFLLFWIAYFFVASPPFSDWWNEAHGSANALEPGPSECAIVNSVIDFDHSNGIDVAYNRRNGAPPGQFRLSENAFDSNHVYRTGERVEDWRWCVGLWFHVQAIRWPRLMSHPETVPHLSVDRPIFYQGGRVATVQETISPSDSWFDASIRARNITSAYEIWIVVLRRDDPSGRWFVLASRGTGTP